MERRNIMGRRERRRRRRISIGNRSKKKMKMGRGERRKKEKQMRWKGHHFLCLAPHGAVEMPRAGEVQEHAGKLAVRSHIDVYPAVLQSDEWERER